MTKDRQRRCFKFGDFQRSDEDPEELGCDWKEWKESELKDCWRLGLLAWSNVILFVSRRNELYSELEVRIFWFVSNS